MAATGNAATGPRSREESEDRSDRPRDAATLILVDTSGQSLRVLMGRRRDDQIFLPGKYVFPGGRLDRADFRAPSLDELHGGETARLLAEPRGEPSQARPRALALAAIRETFEETGLLVGEKAKPARIPDSGPWQTFLAHGVVPRLGGLTFLARAITPPGQKRRYDTRFFVARAEVIAERSEATDGELDRLDWFSLEDARALDVPGITRTIVEDLADRLKLGLEPGAPWRVPFYFFKNGAFERAMIETSA